MFQPFVRDQRGLEERVGRIVGTRDVQDATNMVHRINQAGLTEAEGDDHRP